MMILFPSLTLAAVLASCPVASAQQAAVPPAPLQTPGATAAPSEKTEADKKLDAILKANNSDRVKLVEELEQFIADNPTYPRLKAVYRDLVVFASPTANPGKAVELADLAVAKYPDDRTMRADAVQLKIRALQAQKNDAAVREIAEQLLERETSPYVLEAAATFARADTLRLLDKAIVERSKNTSRTASPTLSDLHWEYAKRLVEDGEYEKALDRVAVAEQTGEDPPLEAVAAYAKLRADIYAKMGRSDLELDSYTKAFAARMDPATRDRIRELAVRNGKKPEGAFARARELRGQNAVAITTFELKGTDGAPVTLARVRAKAKVTLVNFFFPT